MDQCTCTSTPGPNFLRDGGDLGNSLDKLCLTRSVAYSLELVLLNKHQSSGDGAYLDCYQHHSGGGGV